ncbi:MAG: RHS repeat domain-containing protein, partial [Vicinamibacterales bacterium]
MHRHTRQPRRLPLALQIVLICGLLLGISPLHLVSRDTGIAPRTADATGPNDFSYIYDDLGRLLAVVDPNSETAVYEYDATGNILSVTRHSSSVTSIIKVTPDNQVVGGVINIYGTAFST